ncbi:DUF2730 family protein [Profundibacter sp.]
MNFDINPTITMNLILSVIVIFFAWFRTRNHNVDDEFKTLTDRMDRHSGRIAALEQTITVMPDKDDMHKLQIEMVKMTGNLGQIQAVMEGNAKIMTRLEDIVSRHEDHLLEGNKR